MRDIIWTVIVVWLIYKLVEIFKALNVKKSYINNQPGEQQSHTSHNKTTGHGNKDIKEAVRQHINKTGEYVDFEEIK